MKQLTETEFLAIAKGESDGIVILGTATCHKCAHLKKQAGGNADSYVFNPSDSEALEFIQSNGLMCVPITIRSNNGEVSQSNETDWNDVKEELHLT
jgi:hypothetical protein